MTRHLTVRLAWHDHDWDGTICQNPEANCYCSGSHSLLSDRIARDKFIPLENANRGKRLDALLPVYLPPCYWSSSAFSTEPTKVIHEHPFRNYKAKHRIPDKLPASSVYTWPFRLSMTHDRNAQKRDGKYPPDWNERADRYMERLTVGKSLVFFYLNYDNPVSADEYRYALVGCSRLADIQRTGSFGFSPEELAELCTRDGMKNFGSPNWALKVSHDFAGTGVRLPYREYLAHVAQSPADEGKLDEIKVLIQEPALLPGAKYVSEQVNDDASLYLLYKLRKAFERVAEHGIAAPGSAIQRIDGYIEEFWRERGLYPGLAAVVGILGTLRQGDPDWEQAEDGGLVQAVRARAGEEEQLLDTMFALLSSKTKPEYLTADQMKRLSQARRGFQAYTHLDSALRRLSLFALTPRQLSRVLFPDVAERGGEPHPFSGRRIGPNDIAANPYLLCEEYVPTTTGEKEESLDRGREVPSDGPIDYFTIDIGLFPDEDRYECSDAELHDLHPVGKERLRAFAVTTLREQQDQGHTYAALPALLEASQSHPLFYRKQLALTREHFLSPGHLAHFRQRLHVEELQGEYFFYLAETKQAEEIVARLVNVLLQQPPHKADMAWVDDHLQKEATILSAKAKGFSPELFKAERRKLIEGVLTQRLFLVTGRPGSGKTRALREVVGKLRERGEKVTVLAPTGKATLRVREETPGAEVETIDRWLNRSGLRRYLNDLSELPRMAVSATYQRLENLIIDESSMVDLAKLAVVCRAIEVHEPDVARVVFVGDEHQLPPIGMGRSLYDLLEYVQSEQSRGERHVVRLRSNCRQRQDQTVVDAAYLFAGKNRYRTDLYRRLLTGGKISEHLRVEYWESPDDLQRCIEARLDALLGLSATSPDKAVREKALNLRFNLYENGYVKGYRQEKKENELRVDAVQLLSPYRAGYAGAMGLNEAVREQYRAISYVTNEKNNGFAHSDKIIRTRNYYKWVNHEGKWTKDLVLSNGSIGVLNNTANGWKAFFTESSYPFDWSSMDEEDFEAAYAISVHKAQGSEFDEVFVIIPERRALLSRELVYTAMTRSTGPLTLFVQRTPRENPLEIARSRSDLLRRNSSLLTSPVDGRRAYQPEPGITVKSKVEYVIYEALRQAREAGKVSFGYEKPPLVLPFSGKEVEVHPDFTLIIGDRRYYWEHLGMLDRDDYAEDWEERRKAYERKGLADSLITSDDSYGIRAEKVSGVIRDLVDGRPIETSGNPFSRHHYVL
jgi:ATP-dependent exoDNAse (exonuclease V) alpha subunit